MYTVVLYLNEHYNELMKKTSMTGTVDVGT